MKRQLSLLSAAIVFTLASGPLAGHAADPPASKPTTKTPAKTATTPAAKTAAKTATKASTKASTKAPAKSATKGEAEAPAKTVEDKGSVEKAVVPENLSAGTPTPPPPGSSPMADLKKSDQALKKLFQRSAPSWSPEQDAKRSEMRKIVAGFLDYEELAHRALAKHWDGIAPASRNEFVTVLRDLIERNYIRQVHGQANYDLSFDKEVIDGSNASVTATLKTTANGKKVVIEMEYKLLHKSNRWLVFDVVTDEQSMLENYRAEFGKVITKEGFDTLLKRMKKRLEKLD